jgi:hypothetical protein
VKKINATAVHVRDECDKDCRICQDERLVEYQPGVCHRSFRGYGILRSATQEDQETQVQKTEKTDAAQE